MTSRHLALLLSLATACGTPGGPLKGTVTVEGGSAANVVVLVYGPTSKVALTKDDGTFLAEGLPDGRYAVRATVRGAQVEELSAPVTLANGKQDVEPVLAFKQKAALGKLTGRVTVENGSAANVVVLFEGPQSGAAVTGADGSFTSSELPDGSYVVRATVRGAEVADAAATTKLSAGKQDGDVTLAFRMPATSTVSGKVVFSDGSDASNLLVVLGGSTFLGARTNAMGAFSFSNVPAGGATLSVEAPDTREGRLSVGVAVSGAMVDVGSLTFTATARVGGVVTAGGNPVGGALVRVAGTGLTATTTATGRFDFSGLAVGDTSFLVERGADTGTAMARLTRGANADVMVSLTLAPPPPTGTITGVVAFGSPQAPNLITVTAEGTMATARPATNGAFTLQVPVGEWEVTASAPFHPTQSLGRVKVLAGQTTTLEGQTLSFFAPIFRGQAPFTSLTFLAGSQAATQPWAAVMLNDTLGTKTALVNPRTREVRVVAYGNVITPAFSSTGRYFAYGLQNQLFTYDITTGQTRLWGPVLASATVVFSTDESVMFVLRTGVVDRITLASGQVARFPATGTANLYLQTNDRIFTWDPANEVTLIEPTSSTVLFSNVASFTVVPTAIATTNCAATCTLRVVAPTGRTASVVAGAFPITPVINPNAPGDYPLISFGTTSMVIRASDGTAYPLPTGNLVAAAFSPTGTRFAYVINGPWTLREDTLPPSATPPSPVAQSTLTFSFTYVSPTRMVALDNGLRRLIDVRTGVATIDSDVDPAMGAAALITPMVVWRAPSAAKWRVILGDKPTVDLDAPVGPGSPLPINYTARLGLPVPEYGAVAFDPAWTYVIDGRTNTVRRVFGGVFATAGRSGANEYFTGSWGTQAVLMTADTGQLIDVDPRRFTQAAPAPLTSQRVMFAILANDLWMGAF